MRGEKEMTSSCLRRDRGSPPLARGKVSQEIVDRWMPRITPACAGKSSNVPSFTIRKPHHPRLRGEKFMVLLLIFCVGGSPPLARGKAASKTACTEIPRITPACAGKSGLTFVFLIGVGDHPRLRGEKPRYSQSTASSRGSPPLARGKEKGRKVAKGWGRITPACAGKSRT